MGPDAHPLPEDEIGDTMPTEGPSIKESELLEVDEVETSDEEYNVPSNTTEINESSPRVSKKRCWSLI